jgi:hypothetical protein
LPSMKSQLIGAAVFSALAGHVAAHGYVYRINADNTV